MKLIRTNDELICLERVKKVTTRTFGSGAKSNPYKYFINIQYFNDEDCVNIEFDNKKKFDDTFEEIAEILSK